MEKIYLVFSGMICFYHFVIMGNVDNETRKHLIEHEFHIHKNGRTVRVTLFS